MQPMDLTSYRDLWKTHGVMALLASALVARMPVMATMVPLAFLAKDAAGNFGWAGVVAGAYSSVWRSPAWCGRGRRIAEVRARS